MASPYALTADSLKMIIDAEFAAEEVEAIHDRLHESLGQKGRVVGIAPIREIPMASNEIVQLTTAEIRFFNQWKGKVDPQQTVDPRIIAEFAERLRVAVRDASVTISGQLWYFKVTGVEYPPDPVGNNSRFHMTIQAYGNNSSLVETV